MRKQKVASVHIENVLCYSTCLLLNQFMSLKMSFKFHIQFYLNQKNYENYLTRFKFKELLECEKHTRRLE